MNPLILLMTLMVPSQASDYEAQAREAVSCTIADKLDKETSSLSVEKGFESEARDAVLDEIKALKVGVEKVGNSFQEIPLLEDQKLSQKNLPQVPKLKLPPVFYVPSKGRWSWPGDLRHHLQQPIHGLDKHSAETLPAQELIKIHNQSHTYGTLKVKTPVESKVPAKAEPVLSKSAPKMIPMQNQGNSNCPNGNCPNPTYQNRVRKPLFQRLFQ